jgi:dihydroorotase
MFPQDDNQHHHQMRALALVNARLIDPATGFDAFGGLLIANGMIADLGTHITEGSIADAETLDCGGRTIAPGLIDMMVFAG